MSNSKPEGVKGFNMVAGQKSSKQFGANRTCAEEGCSVRLSRYNPGKWCAEHENPRDKKNMAGDGRTSDAKWDEVDRSLGRGPGAAHPRRRS